MFVNPRLDVTKYADESKRLRENLFGILRRELEERRVVELLPVDTMGFLLTNEARRSIGRNYSSQSVRVSDSQGIMLSDQWQH